MSNSDDARPDAGPFAQDAMATLDSTLKPDESVTSDATAPSDAVVTPDGASVPICGAADALRPVTFFLEFPAGVPMPAVSYIPAPLQFDIAGSVAAVAKTEDPCGICVRGTVPTVRLTIKTVDQKLWTLGIRPQGAADEFQATANELVNTAVSLMFRYGSGFQIGASTGFSLKDSAGRLVMAADDGPWVPVILAADIPFILKQGGPVCQLTPGACFDLTYHELTFTGQTSVTVGLAIDGEFSLADRLYRARNAGEAELSSIRCSDVSRGSFWAVWRERLPPAPPPCDPNGNNSLPANPTGCPVRGSQPSAGTACSVQGLTCTYVGFGGTCHGGGPYSLNCCGGSWAMSESAGCPSP